MVVDRAGADDDDEAVTAALQHVDDGSAARLDDGERVVAHRNALLQQGGRDQRADGADAHVVDSGGVERGVAGTDLAVVKGVVECGHLRVVGSKRVAHRQAA